MTRVDFSPAVNIYGHNGRCLVTTDELARAIQNLIDVIHTITDEEHRNWAFPGMATDTPSSTEFTRIDLAFNFEMPFTELSLSLQAAAVPGIRSSFHLYNGKESMILKGTNRSITIYDKIREMVNKHRKYGATSKRNKHNYDKISRIEVRMRKKIINSTGMSAIPTLPLPPGKLITDITWPVYSSYIKDLLTMLAPVTIPSKPDVMGSLAIIAKIYKIPNLIKVWHDINEVTPRTKKRNYAMFHAYTQYLDKNNSMESRMKINEPNPMPANVAYGDAEALAKIHQDVIEGTNSNFPPNVEHTILQAVKAQLHY